MKSTSKPKIQVWRKSLLSLYSWQFYEQTVRISLSLAWVISLYDWYTLMIIYLAWMLYMLDTIKQFNSLHYMLIWKYTGNLLYTCTYCCTIYKNHMSVLMIKSASIYLVIHNCIRIWYFFYFYTERKNQVGGKIKIKATLRSFFFLHFFKK